MSSAPDRIQFNDGAAYERYMAKWSQLAGEQFLNWLAPPRGLRWLDVGCGNGAFTEMLVDRCAPLAVSGIDPSAAQLEYARSRPAARLAEFKQGDAMALPFGDDAFDAAVMPLVIFFVPVPLTGVKEMARVVRSGGIVSAYAWDMPGGGFPYDVLLREVRAMGVAVPSALHDEVSSLHNLRGVWADAGLNAIETTVIEVRRTFDHFEDYWETVVGGSSVARGLAGMTSSDREQLRSRLRALLPQDEAGRITYSATANAIRGRV